jgi:hypothetical protein
MKTAGALCSNDAKSCYDRILHSVASLCLQRLGLPEGAIVCMFSTLQNLEHTVRMIYGDSKRTYGGQLWIVPLHGSGQGNGGGPMLWAVVSTPVLKVMRSEGYGTFFEHALVGIQFGLLDTPLWMTLISFSLHLTPTIHLRW